MAASGAQTQDAGRALASGMLGIRRRGRLRRLLMSSEDGSWKVERGSGLQLQPS